MRSAFFAVIGLLVAGAAWAGPPGGRTVVSPALPHAHNDRPFTLGNIRPTPNVRLEWDTAGPDGFRVVQPADSCAVISSDPDIDRTGLICTDTRLCVCSDDAANADECICTYHDETAGVLEVDDGNLYLVGQGGIVAIPSVTGVGTQRFLIRSSNAGVAGFELGEAAASTVTLRAYAAMDQAVLLLAAEAGRQLVIGDGASADTDFAHAAQTNPTLYIHSAVSPAVDATQWLSATHDQTDAVLATGVGDIAIQPASGFVQRMQRIVSCACNYNSGAVACGTVQDGDIVSDVWFEVSTIWDGTTGVVDLGDASDDDRFADQTVALTNAILGVGGYKLTDHSTREAALWSAGAGADQDYVYAGADTLRCTGTAGDSTQGAGTAYFAITRLK